MKRCLYAWLSAMVAILLGMSSSASVANEFTLAVVTHVSDGDTLWVRRVGDNTRHRPIKLRLQGIDAPERCQAWGPQAQQALSNKLLNKEVRLQTRGHDDYDRILGNVWLGEEDVSAWMVETGHAWSYRYRRSLGPYSAQEDKAKQNKRGLFSDPQAEEPRAFRKNNGPCP